MAHSPENLSPEKNGSKKDSLREVRILLAIEDAISADLLDDRLRREGLQTTHADNGIDALRRIRDESFELVVVETRLSGRTGFELLRDLSPLGPRVVLLARQKNDPEEVRAFKLGAAEYITRPFNPEVAVARVLRLLHPDFSEPVPKGNGGEIGPAPHLKER